MAARRATGGPWVGLLMGISRGEAGPAGVVELRAERAGGFLELAVLADFALGAALRSLTGPGTVMPTLTLTLQLWGADVVEDVRVRADADSVAGTVASARARGRRCPGRSPGSDLAIEHPRPTRGSGRAARHPRSNRGSGRAVRHPRPYPTAPSPRST